MINHVRTLLQNTAGTTNQDLASPFAEFTPPQFIPVTLPSHMVRIRNAIFGSRTDMFMMAYRLHELMQVVHTSELEPFLYWFDRRVTYLPFKGDLFDVEFGIRRGDEGTKTTSGYYEGSFGHQFTLLRPWEPYDLRESALQSVRVFTSNPAAAIYVYGELPAETDGQLFYRWNLKIGGASVRVSELSPQHDIREISYQYENNFTTPIPLTGSGLLARFSDITIGDQFEVTYMARPSQDIGEILGRLEVNHTADTGKLFGQELVEPHVTFRRVWQRHPFGPMRLSALALMMALRTDALRDKSAA